MAVRVLGPALAAAIAFTADGQTQATNAWAVQNIKGATLELSNSSGVGIDAVMVEAVVFGWDLKPDQLMIEIDYGDPGSVSTLVPNVLAMPQLRDMNTTLGRVGGHFYKTPGTYTITATISDGVTTVTATAQHTVVDEVYDNVIVVSKDNQFIGAPAGDVQLTNLEDAFLPPYNGNSKSLILLKRGEDYSEVSPAIISLRSFMRFQVSSWGEASDPKPILNQAFVQTGHDGHYYNKWHDVRFQGAYDVHLEDGETQGYLRGQNSAAGKPDGVTQVFDCEFSGNGIALWFDNANAMIGNTHVTNWQNMGIFDIKSGVLVGNNFSQKIDARGGGLSKNNNQDNDDLDDLDDNSKTEHAAGRIEGGTNQRYAWLKNKLLSNSGWFNTGGVPAHQPNSRILTGDAIFAISDNVFIFTGNWCEGGISAIDFKDASARPFGDGNRILIAYNLFIMTANLGYSLMDGDKPGFVARNNIFLSFDVPKESPNEQRYTMLSKSGGTASAAELLVPLRVYSNTWYFLPTQTSQLSVNDPNANVRGFVDEGYLLEHNDNLIHAPNVGIPQDAGSFDLVDLQNAEYLGLYWGLNPAPLDTQYGQNNIMAFLPHPKPGNIAYQTGGAKAAVDDFFGNLRPQGTASQGALEPV